MMKVESLIRFVVILSVGVSAHCAAQNQPGTYTAKLDKQGRAYCPNTRGSGKDVLTDVGGGKASYAVHYYYPGDTGRAVYASDTTERLSSSLGGASFSRPGVGMTYLWAVDMATGDAGGWPRSIGLSAGQFENKPGQGGGSGMIGPRATLKIKYTVGNAAAEVDAIQSAWDFGVVAGSLVAPGMISSGANVGTEQSMEALETEFRRTPTGQITIYRAGRVAIQIPVSNAGWEAQRDAAIQFLKRNLEPLRTGKCAMYEN